MKNLLYQGPDFPTLHENYTKKRCIDEKAQVKSCSHVIFHASVDKVWDVVYDIAQWSNFYPNVNKIRLVSGVKTDAKFAFTLHKFPIQAIFAVVEPNKELSWTGSSL